LSLVGPGARSRCWPAPSSSSVVAGACGRRWWPPCSCRRGRRAVVLGGRSAELGRPCPPHRRRPRGRLPRIRAFEVAKVPSCRFGQFGRPVAADGLSRPLARAPSNYRESGPAGAAHRLGGSACRRMRRERPVRPEHVEAGQECFKSPGTVPGTPVLPYCQTRAPVAGSTATHADRWSRRSP